MDKRAVETIVEELKLKHPKLSQKEVVIAAEAVQICSRLFQEYVERLIREKELSYTDQIEIKEKLRGIDNL